MKEVRLNIPENKLSFFLELFKQLGLDVTEDSEISDTEKDIVRKRIKTTNPEDLVAWNEVRKKFTFKDQKG